MTSMYSHSTFSFPEWIITDLQLLSMQLIPQDILFNSNHALGVCIGILLLSTAKYSMVEKDILFTIYWPYICSASTIQWL